MRSKQINYWIMDEKKYSFKNEIKYNNLKAKEEQAKKDYNRNVLGLNFSAVIFFAVLLATLLGLSMNSNLMMILIVMSLMGVFYFGRELRVLPKGQIYFSVVKILLCVGMMIAYVFMHQGLWDVMDYGILGILLGVIALDIPRILKARKELKG